MKKDIIEENLPYLTEEERKRGKMLVDEIDDLLNSVRNELSDSNPGKAYKSYLNPKIQGLITDINCLNSLIK